MVSEETGGISITYNGVFKHDLTMEEFEEELRRILIPENSQEPSLTERILGGWKNEKKIVYISSPHSYLLAFYLSTLPLLIIKIIIMQDRLEQKPILIRS